MKTLIVIAHPNLESSVVNKRWVQELEKHPELFTLNKLYEKYPDGKIDVAREQALLESHQNIVLQYPLYWFSTTPLLKQWLDEVWLYDWAYGPNGDKLKGKKIAIALSAGSPQESFAQAGITVDDVLLPFRMNCHYVGAQYSGYHIVHDAQNLAGTQTLEDNAKQYVEFVKQLS